jgi:hypothetical protein
MPNLSYSVIDAPQVAPPRVSLLASAQEITDNARWQAGLTFEPVGCGPVGGVNVLCPTDETLSAYSSKIIGGESESEVPAPGGVQEYEPYVLWFADSCSTATFMSRDFVGRALARYQANESAFMAFEFSTGNLAVANGLPNFYLQNTEAFDAGFGVAWPVARALGQLQYQIGMGLGFFGRYMIHAPRDVASMWLEFGLIRREGALLLDAYDNIVVADAGYPGGSPEGNPRTTHTAWVYATDPVQVRRDGQVRLLPERDEVMGGAALNRDTNLIEWRVERLVAAYPAGCLHAAIEVDLCETECPDISVG